MIPLLLVVEELLDLSILGNQCLIVPLLILEPPSELLLQLSDFSLKKIGFSASFSSHQANSLQFFN